MEEQNYLPLIKPGQNLEEFLQSFWTNQIDQVESEISDFKKHELPLARIKKVMKTDPDVKMISAEAPILFSRACEIFISELTCRSWLVAEANKRRTLQKTDVAGAVGLSDQFDFLIDIVPRFEESKRKKGKVSESGDNNNLQQSQQQHQEPYITQEIFESEKPSNVFDQQPSPNHSHDKDVGFDSQINYNDQNTTSNEPPPIISYDPDFLLNLDESSQRQTNDHNDDQSDSNDD